MKTYQVPNVYHRLITFIFVMSAIILLKRKKTNEHVEYMLALLTICGISQILSVSLVSGMRDGVLKGRYAPLHLWMHAVKVCLLLAAIYQTIRSLRQIPELVRKSGRTLTWAISLGVLAILTLEGLHLFVVAGNPRFTLQALPGMYVKATLTILWAVFSFAFMWLGMHHRFRPLRIIPFRHLKSVLCV
jgi:hypothetical protein